MNKQNNGITLIALVITIVVLVILVGVSVSVTINTGLIANTKIAVADYDKAQKEEEIFLTDMEVNMDFIAKETPYKFKNGYLTGVKIIKEEGVVFVPEKVIELESMLPAGYTVHSSDNKDIDNKDTHVITGMVLRKEGIKVGRIVVFGDTNKDGFFNTTDAGNVSNVLTGDESCDQVYDIVAMDVNHDSIIDNQDYNLIVDYYRGVDEIIQSVEVDNKAENIIIKSKQWYQDNYINELPETFTQKYKVYYNETSKRYQINVESGTITADTFLADLQDPDAVLEVYDNVNKKWVKGVTDDTPITNAARVYIEMGAWGEQQIIFILGV